MTPPVVILCGGRGTRLREKTVSMPKALVEIGGRPILDHVIEIYLRQGFTRILLATGYRGEMIDAHVAAREWPAGVTVEALPTGADTPTGGRVKRLAGRLAGAPFCVTYADGVADLDLGALRRHHHAHGKLATVTVVRPHLQWGVAELDDDDRVHLFFDAPPESPTVRGFAGILREGLEGQPRDVVLAVPSDFHASMGLDTVVSPLRLRGMGAILARIQRQLRAPASSSDPEA